MMQAPEALKALITTLSASEESFILLTWEDMGTHNRYTLACENTPNGELQNPFPEERYEVKDNQEHGISIYGECSLELGELDAQFLCNLFECVQEGEMVLQRRKYQKQKEEWVRAGGYVMMKSHLPSEASAILDRIGREEQALINLVSQKDTVEEINA